MKFLVFLLAAYITFLVTSPVICTATCEEERETSCSSQAACDAEAPAKESEEEDTESTCCSSETACSAEMPEEESQEEDTGNTCCTPCCSMQNCHCFFESIAEINFNVSTYSIANQYLLQDDKLNSTYLSDCWQPPETV